MGCANVSSPRPERNADPATRASPLRSLIPGPIRGCERIGYELGGQQRIVDADDELRVMLVMKPDADRLVRVMNVPESPLAALQEAARGDESWDIGPSHAKPVKYAVGLGHSRIHTRDVLEWHLEPAREGEELVGARDVDDETYRSQLDRRHRR
jgi:hypothetical protein